MPLKGHGFLGDPVEIDLQKGRFTTNSCLAVEKKTGPGKGRSVLLFI